MYVDKFGRTGTGYDGTAAVHLLGNFLPLTHHHHHHHQRFYVHLIHA